MQYLCLVVDEAEYPVKLLYYGRCKDLETAELEYAEKKAKYSEAYPQNFRF